VCGATWLRGGTGQSSGHGRAGQSKGIDRYMDTRVAQEKTRPWKGEVVRGKIICRRVVNL
jgi:hypothetical protein